jgi:1-deoxy-D-xylulose-5-phosphate reductoisomerase
MAMQAITILGATGSIGVSTLDVLSRHRDRYRVYALTAHSNVVKLAAQCLIWQPEVAIVGTPEAASQLTTLLHQSQVRTEVDYGERALCEVASASSIDMVMAAIVGAAGLRPTLAAAKAGKKILLANKEALVMSGQLLIDTVIAHRATLLPIDSEHNAIFQCLPAIFHQHNGASDLHRTCGIAKILLTASGGPFLERDLASLDCVTPQEAVAHPKWVMGRKISVDSATMMNKGLEVIEAHWLFGASAAQIEVVIHPQSVVHSMVSYIDGSVLAQMGNPDMRTPIAHALAYPNRIEAGVTPLDLTTIGKLTFEPPDLARFPCLKLAYHALDASGSAPAILNAANEVAVEAFLNGRVGFRMIDQLISKVMDQLPTTNLVDIECLIEQDQRARALTHSLIH